MSALFLYNNNNSSSSSSSSTSDPCTKGTSGCIETARFDFAQLGAYLHDTWKHNATLQQSSNGRKCFCPMKSRLPMDNTFLKFLWPDAT